MLSPMNNTFQNAADKPITKFSGFTDISLGKTHQLRLDAFRPHLIGCPRLGRYNLADEKRCPKFRQSADRKRCWTFAIKGWADIWGSGFIRRHSARTGRKREFKTLLGIRGDADEFLHYTGTNGIMPCLPAPGAVADPHSTRTLSCLKRLGKKGFQSLQLVATGLRDLMRKNIDILDRKSWPTKKV